MWILNSDTNKWEAQHDTVKKIDFNEVRQDLEKLRFYSKGLRGTVYLPIKDLENVYDILKYVETPGYYVGSGLSSYSTVSDSDHTSVTSVNLDDYIKFLTEYGYSLKNMFTPKKVIDDAIKNFIEVDVATTDSIDINNVNLGLTIDEITLLNGHKILVKDQKTVVTLPSSTDPETIFVNYNYYVQSTDQNNNTVTYFYYNNENGLYEFKDGILKRLTDLDTYESCVRNSISVKLGEINFDKQFHLSRLKNGQFPLTNDANSQSIEFQEKHNYILRNKIGYQNIFNLDYNDAINIPPLTINNDFITPERDIFVGNFGIILNYQDGVLHIMQNPYKTNLNALKATSNKIWICGDAGTLLSIDKITMEIEKVDVGEYFDFKSIDFFDDFHGFIVGSYNTMYYTKNGGEKWEKIVIDDFDKLSYNKVIYTGPRLIFIGGDNGAFIRLVKDNNDQWVASRFHPVQKDVDGSEYLILDNIKDMKRVRMNTWGLSFTNNNFTYNANSFKDFILISGDNNVLFLYDLNNFSHGKNFLYFKLNPDTKIDISSFAIIGSKIYFNDNRYIYKIDLNDYSTLDFKYNTLTTTTLYTSSGYDLYSINNTSPDLRYVRFRSGSEIYLIGAGDNIINKLAKFNTTNSTITDYDTVLRDKLKSKLLFLDYDMAGKANFYDKDENYTLPNKGSFSSTTSFIRFDPISNELGSETGENWITYFCGNNKVFKYNDHQTLVSYNRQFDRDTNGAASSSYSISPSEITKTTSNFSTLINTTNAISFTITTPGSPSQKLFLYKNIMVLRVPSTYQAVVGDVLHMTSGVVDGIFMVNRKETFGSSSYLYMYSNFNGTIINNLVATTVNVTFRNLNKYANNSGSLVNEWTDITDILSKHPFGEGYYVKQEIDPVSSNIIFCIHAKLTEKTAYYNMQTSISYASGSVLMKYDIDFIDFGFKPYYNILAALNKIESTVFTPSKTFKAMPVLNNIPYNTLVVLGGPLSGRYTYICLDPSLKNEWDSFFVNTFIDVTVTGTPNYTTKVYIVDKFYDESDPNAPKYILQVSKPISFGASPSAITLASRNTLRQISDDLREFDNIQSIAHVKNLNGIDQTFYGKNLSQKYNTDSYAKILLSDNDIKKYVTGIVYTDYKNEMAFNIINVDKKHNVTILSTFDNGSKIGINCAEPHDLKVGDGITIYLTGDPVNNFNGYKTVLSIQSDTSFTIDEQIVYPEVVEGYFLKGLFDPFLEYLPSDIIDVGVDKLDKFAITIKPENVIFNELISIRNIDFNRYKFLLVDGVDIDVIRTKYSWILEAEIEDAVIGQDENGIVWYKGTWLNGRWFGSQWYSGRWLNGQWYGGTWNSLKTETNPISAKVNTRTDDNTFSKWYNGKWHEGFWKNGIWFKGTWYTGEWTKGYWYDGTWNDGTWLNGYFSGGNWIFGKWYNGFFTSIAGIATWYDGEWYGGDFENGVWKNGSFDQKSDSISRFGTQASLTRQAIWENGRWFNGEFHSRLNADDSGNAIVSLTNNYSIWYGGIWNNGTWYGGTAYNITMNGGRWLNGVLLDLPIISISGNTITVDGSYFNYFQRTNEIWLVNSTKVSLGEPYYAKYLISDFNLALSGSTEVLEITTTQTISLNIIDNNTSNYNQVRIASKYENVEWENGVWKNGVFKGRKWKGGLWYNGVFLNGEWL